MVMAQAPTLSVSESCERTVMREPGVSEIVLPAPVPLTAPDTLIVTPVLPSSDRISAAEREISAVDVGCAGIVIARLIKTAAWPFWAS